MHLVGRQGSGSLSRSVRDRASIMRCKTYTVRPPAIMATGDNTQYDNGYFQRAHVDLMNMHTGAATCAVAGCFDQIQGMCGANFVESLLMPI